MRRLLDQLSFKKNRYARPNQDWICGRTDEGHPCPLGPDDRGACRHTGECFPAKSGDRWNCTRREAQGGKCAAGPLPDGTCSHPIPPCQPLPSLRHTRGQFTWILVALTLGGLLLALAGGSRRQWISPGELTVHHSTSGTDCKGCHDPGKRGSGSPTEAGLPPNHVTGDSRLCLNCHSLGPQPFSAHGATVLALAAVTARPKTQTSTPSMLLRASTAVTVNHLKIGQLACSTCHQEHHGKDFNLAHLSENQCQVCHRVQFASLANGHPEFTGYPYQRRTRIYFDHASHLDKPQGHFLAETDKAPTSCQACHVPAVSGGKMLVNNFEQSCSACHVDNMRRSSPVAFFRVPGIDVGSLSKAGISIGQWPQGPDDTITPFMELLLGSDTPGGRALVALKGKDLNDLRGASRAQLAAAGKLAWAVKELLFDFETEGQPFLLKRLQAAVAPDQNEVQLAALTGGIPRAGIIAARKEWMPDLLREIPDYRRGVVPPPVPPPPAPRATPAATPAPAPAEKAKEPSSDSDILGDTEPATASTPPAKSTEAPPPGDDILGGAAPAAPSPPPPPSSKPRQRRKTVLQSPPASVSPAAAPAPAPESAAQPKPETEPATDETWMSVAGWYRAKDLFTFSYRPSGHADPFLIAWLNFSAATPSASGILRDLTKSSGAGSCAKCHTVDDIEKGKSRINWVAARSEPNEHPFTKFSHTTHLSLMTEKGCQTCHFLNPESKYSTYFQPADPPNRDPSHFESNFASLPKMECAKCHTAKVAGESCLLCHNYHTGSFATDMSRAAQFH